MESLASSVNRRLAWIRVSLEMFALVDVSVVGVGSVPLLQTDFSARGALWSLGFLQSDWHGGFTLANFKQNAKLLSRIIVHKKCCRHRNFSLQIL